MENRIFIKNPVNHIEKKLSKATLFVLTSDYEGMPNAVLEAMSQGLPVIATNSSEAIKTIIKNNENGIIVEKRNEKELTKKIEYLLDNKEKRTKISKRSNNKKVGRYY